jgi:hypothetical protein
VNALASRAPLGVAGRDAPCPRYLPGSGECYFADVGTYTRAVMCLILGCAGVLKLDGGRYAPQPSGQRLVGKGCS